MFSVQLIFYLDISHSSTQDGGKSVDILQQSQSSLLYMQDWPWTWNVPIRDGNHLVQVWICQMQEKLLDVQIGGDLYSFKAKSN